jgi:hypothetical protein
MEKEVSEKIYKSIIDNKILKFEKIISEIRVNVLGEKVFQMIITKKNVKKINK